MCIKAREKALLLFMSNTSNEGKQDKRVNF
jgi:hypothetical protein